MKRARQTVEAEEQQLFHTQQELFDKIQASYNNDNDIQHLHQQVDDITTSYNQHIAPVTSTSPSPSPSPTNALPSAITTTTPPWKDHRVAFSDASVRTQKTMVQEGRSAIASIFHGPNSVAEFIAANPNEAVIALKNKEFSRTMKDVVRDSVIADVWLLLQEACRIHDTANVSLKKFRAFRESHSELFPSERVGLSFARRLCGTKRHSTLCILFEQELRKELDIQTASAIPVHSHEIQIGSVRVRYSQTNVKEKVTAVLQALFNLGLIDSHTKIKIKVSGDGYRSTTKTGYVVIGFVVLDGAHPHNREQTWALHVGHHAESTIDLAAISKELADQLDEVLATGVKLKKADETIEFGVDLFVSADQKFLCAILGLGGPSKAFFCPWCEAHRSERHLFKPCTLRTSRRLAELAKQTAEIRCTRSEKALEAWISSEYTASTMETRPSLTVYGAVMLQKGIRRALCGMPCSRILIWITWCRTCFISS